MITPNVVAWQWEMASPHSAAADRAPIAEPS
jgi:hypothetical protein